MLEMMNPDSSSLLSSSRRSRERGYTLYEIMVVLAIIGLVAVIGFPMMARAVVRARVLSEVGVLKQAVAMARIHALKRGGGVAVRLA